MSSEAYNLDDLRRIIRALQEENKILKDKLARASIPFDNNELFNENSNDEQFDLDQGMRIIHPYYISEQMGNYFFAMFWGRKDVYAKRGKNGGYFPQCDNRWNYELCPKQRKENIRCDDCPNTKWTNLSVKKILNHLLGYNDEVIGIYPLLNDGTCRFIVFDFDNHEKGKETFDFANDDSLWQHEVDVLRKMCTLNGITPLIERSRSGKGAHLWIFFKEPITASLARNFGFMLLDKGCVSINIKSFTYYDRLYPNQDFADKLGNLIALPLQGQALKQGNSAFVDENWNAYADQWDVLLNKTQRLSKQDIEAFMLKWQNELAMDKGLLVDYNSNQRVKPWRKKHVLIKEDVIGKLHLVLSDGIYVDTINLRARIQNQLRALAAFDNPEFYKNKRLGYSNYYNSSVIYLGKDIDGYIQLPRGLLDEILLQCEKANIEVEIQDEREKGRRIKVEFKGDLYNYQEIAWDKLSKDNDGILSAATSFGKTVVCSYIIAQRKVNTLILLQSKNLLNQWVDELNKFLDIDEEPPYYETKTGRRKQRDSIIGILHGSKNTLGGIVDVAMINSIYSKGKFNELLSSYGMVIVDECHHSAATTSIEVLKKVNAKYLYGVSATLKRADKLDKIIYMMLGPLRHTYTALERTQAQGIKQYVIPRYTRVVDSFDSKNDINKAYLLISSNKVRNEMIVEDAIKCIANNQTPLILTRYKEHAKILYDLLQNEAKHVFLLYGDNSDKENEGIRLKLKQVNNDEPLILIATGQKVGEGFDFARLDVLLLVSPISFEGRLEQYVGRLNRNYQGKDVIYVYDYIDAHMHYFNKMYNKRLKTYKRLGFQMFFHDMNTKQEVNSIFDCDNYQEIFEQDLIEANKNIVIASANLSSDKVLRFIDLVKEKQEKGVQIMVITNCSDDTLNGNSNVIDELIMYMYNVGIEVITKEYINTCFAIVDDELVWHGGMNLLGKVDIWDNLIRIKNYYVAQELLSISLAD